MAEAVIAVNEVSLNAVRYKIAGPVKRSLASVYPGKLVTGDYTKDSNPILSTLALSDHRGGIGLDIMTGEGDTDRSWYSTADIRYKGHLILPPLVYTTESLPAGLSQTYHLMSYQGNVFASVDSTDDGVYGYTPGSPDSWGDKLLDTTTLPNAHGRYALADIDGTLYLVFSTGTGKYGYYNGSAWAERTLTNGGGMSIGWNGRVWTISEGTGYKLLYTFTPGSSETFLGQTPMFRAAVGTCQPLVAPDASGKATIYLATTQGLYAYDIGNDAWIATGLSGLSDSPTIGGIIPFANVVLWRGDMYYGCRSSVLKYSLGSGGATITSIGLDRDNGLPSGKGYIIHDMVASFNEIIVSMRGGASESRKSLILAYDGRGWRVLYESSTNDESLRPLLVTRVSGGAEPTAYRLFFANNTTSPFNISWLPLQSDLLNPLQVSTYPYAAAATHDWPWFTAGQDDVTKVAVRVKIQTTNPTTSETVKVYYAINRSATFQLMTNSTYTTGVITAAGLHTFDFPSVDSWVSTTARVGVAFRSIQFRVVFARGSTTTNTPDVLSLTLEYYKKLDPKYQFQVTLDLNNEYKSNTPKQLRDALLTAQETATLVEFTYRDPGTNTDATFYVQVQPLEGTEQTGVDERGVSTLHLVEV